MARSGITYEEVATAADQLKQAGENPTVDRIRGKLGDTGSKSTILPFLRQWRSQAFDLSEELLESLPYHLLSTFVETWKQLNNTTDERIGSLSEQHQKEIDSLKEALTQLQSEKKSLHAQYKQESDTNQILRLEKASVESELRHEQQEHAKLRENYKNVQTQLIEMREEKNRFHTLATNLQETFTHYQGSVQARQIEQDFKIGHLETQRDALQEDSRKQKELIHTLHTNIELKNHMLNKYKGLEIKLEECLKEQAGLVREHTLLKAQYEQLEICTQQQTQDLEKSRSDNIVLEREKLLLEERVERLDQNLQKEKDQLETLRKENHSLIKDNAELQGVLKSLTVEEKVA
jgi:chromosome segregation ATPase